MAKAGFTSKFTKRGVVQVFAYGILIFGTMALAFLGKPAEMGMAIVAAGIALVFSDIERFKRVKGAGFEAEMFEKIAAVVDKETEPLGDDEDASPLAAELQIDTKAVMRALNHPEYTWRYLRGIAKDSKQTPDQAATALQWLVEHGYARRSHGNNAPIWSLTEVGRTKDILDDFEVITD